MANKPPNRPTFGACQKRLSRGGGPSYTASYSSGNITRGSSNSGRKAGSFARQAKNGPKPADSSA